MLFLNFFGLGWEFSEESSNELLIGKVRELVDAHFPSLSGVRVMVFHFFEEIFEEGCSVEKLFRIVELFVVLLHVSSVLFEETFLLLGRVNGDEGSDCQDGKDCD